MTSALFQPGYIGKMQLKNRIVFPAVATKLPSAVGEVSDDYVAFLEERARGGAGMLVVENTTIDWHRGKGGATLVRADSSEFVPGLHRLVEACHRYDAKVGVQLQHVGRQTKVEYTFGQRPLAPSKIPPVAGASEPEAMTPDDIALIVAKFVSSAVLARNAGFDFVELHGAHGYLLTQFFSPAFNQRDDEYGGDLPRRARLICEIVERIREELADLPLLFRISADEHIPGGSSFQDVLWLVQRLEDLGVAAIHVSAGVYESKPWIFPPMEIDYGYNIQVASEIKRHVGIPVIVVGKLSNRGLAEDAVGQNRVDFVALGRPLVADPFLPLKWQKRVDQDVVPCIYCNECIRHVSRQWPIRCTVNPAAGREREVASSRASIRRTDGPRYLVVGGGPAGMTAAVALAELGGYVILYEARPELGGELRTAMIPPEKAVLRELLSSLVDRLYRQNERIEIRLGETATVSEVGRYGFAGVVLAAGAVQDVTEFDDARDNTRPMLLREAFRRPDQLGDNVVVIGGGTSGCELAAYLASLGQSVTIVEREGELARDCESNTRMLLLERLERLNIEARTCTKVLKVHSDSLELQCGGDRLSYRHTGLVYASGWSPNRDLADQISAESGVPTVLIGDCVQPRNLFAAIREGAEVAHTLSCRRNVEIAPVSEGNA